MTGGAPHERASLRVRGARAPIFSAAFTPDNKTLALGADSGYGSPATVQLFDLTTLEPEVRARFKAVGGAERASFFPNGKTLAFYSNHYPTAIQLWDLSGEPKQRAVLQLSRPGIASAIATDGKTLASYLEGAGNVQIWNLTGAQPVKQALLEAKTPYSLAAGCYQSLEMFPDGKMLAVVGSRAGADPGVILWDLTDAKPKVSAFLPLGKDSLGIPDIRALAVAPDGKTLAAARGGGKIVWWDVEKSRTLRGWTLPDGNWDGDWAPELAKKVTLGAWDLPGDMNQLSFAPDGRHLITANSNGTAYVLRLRPTTPTKP